VEDARVAAKMAYFIQLNTLGLSQDAQARGITLLRAVMSSYGGVEPEREVPFFHYGQAVLEDRWRRMRQALENSSRFVLPEYESSFCSFLGKSFRDNPGSSTFH
jgi:L-tryptophan--pyruvate aminotransferase